MTNPIQTPLLINGKYYRQLRQTYFTVVSDSLAPLMWRGYDLEGLLARSFDSFDNDSLLVVECRIARRKQVSYQVGFFHSVNQQILTLHYDGNFGTGSRRVKTVYPNWTIPLRQIKRFWQVDKVVRWYAQMHKFYPYAGYGK